MAFHKKYTFSVKNYGIYDNWSKDSRTLPDIREYTEEIPAEENIEFGYIVSILKAKGLWLDYTIEHPPFTDEEGNVEPPFTGKLRIPKNTYEFYLGGALWQPIESMKGPWRLITRVSDQVVADMTFTVK